MCRKEIIVGSVTTCNCESENGKRPLSKAQLLERLREYKGSLESELKVVTDKLKASIPGKEVRKHGGCKERD